MKSSLLILAVFLATSGCSAVIRGTKQNVSFTSDPPPATLEIDGSKACSTPCQRKLKRENDHTLRFTKEGYAPKQYELRTGTDAGWMIFDTVMWGVVGLAVSAGTGASKSFDKDRIHAVLEPIQAPTAAKVLAETRQMLLRLPEGIVGPPAPGKIYGEGSCLAERVLT